MMMAGGLGLVTSPVLAQQSPITESQADPGWWLPADFSTEGHRIDELFNIIFYLTSVVGLAVMLCLVVFLFLYRYRAGRQAKFVHGNLKLEAVWTLIPTVILAVIAAYGQSTWSMMKYTESLPSGDEVIRINVTGRQFQWFFHYPGRDGKFGKTHPQWRQNTGEPDREVGLMRGDAEDIFSEEQYAAIAADPARKHLLETDPAAKDDIVIGQMVVPQGKKILCTLNSIDVIHSFYLPQFRVKQDLVPGLLTTAWFEATATSGEYVGRSADQSPTLGYAKPFDIVCAELCGQGHFKMRGQLFVVTDDQYKAFLAEQEEDLDLNSEEDSY